MITRFEDCDQLARVQRQLSSAYPQYLVLKGDHPYDEVDALAADVCSTIKRRGDRFDSDDQLRSWLDEDHVQCTPGKLSAAMLQLERIGRLNRPRQDHWPPIFRCRADMSRSWSRETGLYSEVVLSLSSHRASLIGGQAF